MRRFNVGFFEQWGNPSLLECSGEDTCEKGWDYVCLERCWSCCGNMMIWQCGLQQRKMKAKTDTYSGLMDILICTIFSLLPWDWSDSHEKHRITRDGKWVGKGREEDTTEERWEGERERRYLKCVLSFVWCPVLNVDVELRVYSCLPCVTPWMFIKRPSFVILHRLLVPSLLHSSYPGSKKHCNII